MTGRARALAQRRAELVARSTALRAELAATGASLQARLAPADRVVSAARAHPILTALVAGGGALLAGRFFPRITGLLRALLFLARV